MGAVLAVLGGWVLFSFAMGALWAVANTVAGWRLTPTDRDRLDMMRAGGWQVRYTWRPWRWDPHVMTARYTVADGEWGDGVPGKALTIRVAGSSRHTAAQLLWSQRMLPYRKAAQ
jgi:hypothetical protein